MTFSCCIDILNVYLNIVLSHTYDFSQIFETPVTSNLCAENIRGKGCFVTALFTIHFKSLASCILFKICISTNVQKNCFVELRQKVLFSINIPLQFKINTSNTHMSKLQVTKLGRENNNTQYSRFLCVNFKDTLVSMSSPKYCTFLVFLKQQTPVKPNPLSIFGALTILLALKP